MFVFSGPGLSEEEIATIVPEIVKLGLPSDIIEDIKKNKCIPIIGKEPPKTCIFLKNKLCAIHSVKPEVCKDYPLEILVYDYKVKIKISYDCPRAESIERALKINVPLWLRNRIKSKEMEIEVVSFYEENIKYYLGEE